MGGILLAPTNPIKSLKLCNFCRVFSCLLFNQKLAQNSLANLSIKIKQRLHANWDYIQLDWIVFERWMNRLPSLFTSAVEMNNVINDREWFEKFSVIHFRSVICCLPFFVWSIHFGNLFFCFFHLCRMLGLVIQITHIRSFVSSFLTVIDY